jgi:hypothetical protein
MLINIGLMRTTHMTAILAGTENPSNHMKDSQWMLQVTAAISHINKIAISWNRFVTCAPGIHPDLAELCEKENDAVRSLEPINMTSFWEENSFRATESPRLYANWLISRLCEMLIQLWQSKTSSAMAKKFVSLMAKNMITTEMNMSQPVVYKNVIAVAKEKMASALADTTSEIPTGESDIEAKAFISNILSTGETFETEEIDVDNYAESYGDDAN